MKLSFQSISAVWEHIKIQEYQVKRHQATLIISSILTKNYNPIYLLPLHETVDHKASITERSTTTYYASSRLDFWSLQLGYIRFASGYIKAVRLMLDFLARESKRFVSVKTREPAWTRFACFQLLNVIKCHHLPLSDFCFLFLNSTFQN